MSTRHIKLVAILLVVFILFFVINESGVINQMISNLIDAQTETIIEQLFE